MILEHPRVDPTKWPLWEAWRFAPDKARSTLFERSSIDEAFIAPEYTEAVVGARTRGVTKVPGPHNPGLQACFWPHARSRTVAALWDCCGYTESDPSFFQ